VRHAHERVRDVACGNGSYARAHGARYCRLPMHIDVTDADGNIVFRARIAMWVSPKNSP
jgi:hypothetical protein